MAPIVGLTAAPRTPAVPVSTRVTACPAFGGDGERPKSCRGHILPSFILVRADADPLRRQLVARSNGIVTLADAAFFAGAKALVNSVRRHCPVPVTVLDSGMTPAQCDALRTLGAEVVKASRVVDVDVKSRFGCCYGFFDLCDAPYDNLLYIDADCIVLQDLRELFALIDCRGVVGVTAGQYKVLFNKRHVARVGGSLPRLADASIDPAFAHINPRARGMNTGVVGVRRDVMQKVVALTPKYSAFFEHFRFPDQDLFNIILAELKIDWFDLGYLYNAVLLQGSPEHTKLKHNVDKYAQISRDVMLDMADGKVRIVENKNPEGMQYQDVLVKVLHFSTAEKPWLADSYTLREGMQQLWQRHFDDDAAPCSTPSAPSSRRRWLPRCSRATWKTLRKHLRALSVLTLLLCLVLGVT